MLWLVPAGANEKKRVNIFVAYQKSVSLLIMMAYTLKNSLKKCGIYPHNKILTPKFFSTSENGTRLDAEIIQ